MDTQKAVAARRSIRAYQDKALDAAQLEALVEAANSAPYAGPFHITVVLNKELLDQIDRATLVAMQNSGIGFLQEIAAKPGYCPLFKAPAMLVFSTPDANPYGGANCANACTTAAIVATDMGLGSCYVVTPAMGLGSAPELCQKLDLPEGFKPSCCLMVGYADEAGKPTEPHKKGAEVNYVR